MKAFEALNLILFGLLTSHYQICKGFVIFGKWLYERSRDEALLYQAQGNQVWENSSYGKLLERLSSFFTSFTEYGRATGFLALYAIFAIISSVFFVLTYSQQKRIIPALSYAFAGVLVGLFQAWFQHRQGEWGHELLSWLYAGASTIVILLLVVGIYAHRIFVTPS